MKCSLAISFCLLTSLIASADNGNVDPNFDGREFMAQCQRVMQGETFSAKFKSLISPCFENQDSPFAVTVAAQVSKGRFKLTKVENVGLFLGDEGVACLTKAVGGLYWPVITPFKYTLGAKAEIVKLSKSGSVNVDANPTCHQLPQELKITNKEPIRDSLRVAGATRETDEVVKDLETCEDTLDPMLKNRRMMGLLTQNYRYQDNKSILIRSSFALGEANESYKKCVEKTWLRHISRQTKFVPNFETAGKSVPNDAMAGESETWFARLPSSDGRARHYFWAKGN